MTIYSICKFSTINETETINYYDNIEISVIDIIIDKLFTSGSVTHISGHNSYQIKPFNIYNYENKCWNYEYFNHTQLKNFFDNKTLCTCVIQTIILNSKLTQPIDYTNQYIYALVPSLGLKLTSKDFYGNLIEDADNEEATENQYKKLLKVDIPLEKIEPLKQLHDYKIYLTGN